MEKQALSTMEELLSAALHGEDLCYPLLGKSNTWYPESQWELEYDLVDQFITSPPSYTSNDSSEIISHDDYEFYDNHNNDDGNDNASTVKMLMIENHNNKKVSEKQAVNGGKRKRKRKESQVQDHILAERKRRETLAQLFISLSTLIPGLKKIDKTSILRGAIKHMKHLQERVNVLENLGAQQKNLKSLVVVKKCQLTVDNDDDNNDDNGSFSIIDDNGSSNDAIYLNNSIPEIQVKTTDDTLLLRVHCEQQKDIMTKLFDVVVKHHMSVAHCAVIPFTNLAIDITIVTQTASAWM
ncbi:transcription factor bHLH25-like isoform X2 [Spinacia oleracea]|uniref:Transcription factor bHLH25-like isoform X2 n=1 Tax=Spinacia oleracea TaxID=3562 RepID=A0ABM3QUJ0_SPIOL|nr:transcription factor bHLH25-like isoform X2 [Spinacia oleracea]